MLQWCQNLHGIAIVGVHGTLFKHERLLCIGQYHSCHSGCRLIRYEGIGRDGCDLVDSAVGTYHERRHGDSNVFLIRCRGTFLLRDDDALQRDGHDGDGLCDGLTGHGIRKRTLLLSALSILVNRDVELHAVHLRIVAFCLIGIRVDHDCLLPGLLSARLFNRSHKDFIGGCVRGIDVVHTFLHRGGDDSRTVGLSDSYLTRRGIDSGDLRIRGRIGHLSVTRQGQRINKGCVALVLLHTGSLEADASFRLVDGHGLMAGHRGVVSHRHLIITGIGTGIGVGRNSGEVVGVLCPTVSYSRTLRGIHGDAVRLTVVGAGPT